MPITYSIDAAHGILHQLWTGEVFIRDVAAHWESLLNDPEAMALRKSIADIREANLNFSGRDLANLIRQVLLPAMEGLTWTSAIVVTKPDQFGLSRQYQVYAECYSNDAIFYDIAEAQQWLLQQN